MTDLAAISRLERVTKAMEAGRLPEPDDMAAHARSLRAYIDRDVDTTDRALGLVQAFYNDPRVSLRFAKRDEFLREAARHFNLDADGLEAALRRYELSGRWKRDQTCDECPARLLGSENEFIWKALREVPRFIKRRQIEEILAEGCANLPQNVDEPYSRS